MSIVAKMYISYNDIDVMCKHLRTHVETHRPDIIVGITRGGLLPALYLSHHLEVPLQTIVWQTRDVQKCEHNSTLKESIKAGKRVVFVDDINDTGHTFSSISSAYGGTDNVMYASLVTKVDSIFNSGVTAMMLQADAPWATFPWEQQ